MSPQEDVSGSAFTPGVNTSLPSVCAEVALIMDAVRDGRATTSDRLFVAAHTERCASCASEWAFLQATKSAWARTPMAVPSASLSARIAAATYRKPTFAERFVSAFAFLNPVPMRVAIGVAAVAGISFLVLPRISVTPEGGAPVSSEPAPILAQNTPQTPTADSPEKDVEPTPEKQAPVVKKVSPKPILPAAKQAPVVAVKASNPEPKPQQAVAVLEKPAPKKVARPAEPKPKSMQVAMVTGKSVRERAAPRVESQLPDVKPTLPITKPVEKEPETRIASTELSSPAPEVASVSKPEPRTPAATPSETVAGMVAPDPDPAFSEGSPHIGNLRQTSRRSPLNMSGKFVPTSSSSDAGYIVSAPAKL